MSSMRNAVQRRNHKERAQPREREKWGILEKHKDYALRAKSYNEKKARLQILREKASLRNPDEFSYGMLSAKTDRYGIKIADRGSTVLSNEAARLLKTQDAGYLRTVAAQIRKDRERADSSWIGDALGDDGPEGNINVVGSSSAPKKTKKTVFVDNEQEQKAWTPQQLQSNSNSPPAKTEVEDEDLEDSKAQRRARRQLERAEQREKAEKALRKKIQRQHESQASRVEALRRREDEVTTAVLELELQRAKMGKSRTVGGANKHGVRFKIRERRKR